MISDPNGLPELDSIAALLPAFEFEGVIASGEMGTVYKARQRSLDRDVAVRIIPRGQGDDPAFRSSFETGVKAMASLTHPGIIRVYDSGDVDGLSYMVMEYVPGKSLHHSAHGKAIDARQAAQIVIAICEGLAHAHGNGIIHRAIKPTDILLTPKCEPKIGNFCLARHGAADGSAYMAPELADGNITEGPQCDVHAVGVILSELLTGIPAGTVDAERIVIADPKLAEICHKAAYPDPALRYADAAALAGVLRQWLAAGSPVHAMPQRQLSPHRPKPAVAPRPSARPGRELLKNCAVIAFLILSIGGLWGVYQGKRENLARLQQVEDAKPRVIIVKADAGEVAPQGVETAIVQWESEP